MSWIITALFFWTAPASGGEIPKDIASPYEIIGATLPASVLERSLPVYPEHLTFNISWGIIAVGQATLAAEHIVDFNGTPAFAIISEAKSNAFCDTFHKVRDLNESWVDVRTLGSLGYSKKLREGHFFRDEWVIYDHSAQTYQSRTTNRDGSFRVQTGTAPAFVQDVLSSLYYIRSRPLQVGGEVILDVNTRENWPLVARVIKREVIKTPAGKFNTILVEPALRREGIFIQKGKRLRVWLTDDERKIPVLMKVEVFFGHVTAKLVKML